MKHKNLIIIALICVLVFSIVVLGCYYYFCYYDINNNISSKIDFTADYDKESNNINAVITNNTGDMAVTYIENYKVYKKENSKWYQIIEDKGLSLWPAKSWVMPYSGDNSSKIAFPAYNKDCNLDTRLERGLYKLQMNVSVYDSSQFGTISSEGYEKDGEMWVKASAESRYITIETEFTVE